MEEGIPHCGLDTHFPDDRDSILPYPRWPCVSPVHCTLFTMAEMWTQPKLPFTVDGGGQCDADPQWNTTQPTEEGILQPAAARMETEDMVLREINQVQRGMIPPR